MLSIKQASKRLPKGVSYIEYNGSNKKSTVQCNECLYIWTILPKNIVNNSCKNCKSRNPARNYNSKLKENLIFVDFIDRKLKAHLKCLECGYEDENWSLAPYRASKEVYCPNCQKMEQPDEVFSNVGKQKEEEKEEVDDDDEKQKEEEEEKNERSRVPENIKIETIYVCSLCNYKNIVDPEQVDKFFKCENCKNTGNNRIEKLNSIFEEITDFNITLITYRGSKNESEFKCNYCKNIWKEILFDVYSIICLVCNPSIVNQTYFDKVLCLNRLKSYGKAPKGIEQMFSCICIICDSPIKVNLRKLEYKAACKKCETENPRLNLDKCLKFANDNRDYVSLKPVILNATVDNNIIDTSYYIWTCPRFHSKVLYLSVIRKFFKRYGVYNWCSNCRENHLVVQQDDSERLIEILENIKNLSGDEDKKNEDNKSEDIPSKGKKRVKVKYH